jgi:hypothetical protein
MEINCCITFRQHADDPFPVLKPTDLEDSLVDPEELGMVEDENRFKEARNGDHLMCPFQCDECVFENMQQRSSGTSCKDELTMMCIRRCILDSFWARERGTVGKNLGEVIRYKRICEELGIRQPFPLARGPFPHEDKQGYAVAAVFVRRTLDPGKNTPTIQYETARKMRSMMSNYIHTTPGGTGQSTIGIADRGGSMFSSSPTNSIWFRRFLLGCHKRMGDVRIPDRALVLEERHACLGILEEDWNSEMDIHQRLQIALTGAMLVSGFTAGLRGEELPMTDLGAIRKHWEESVNYTRKPHVPLVLAGRFKNFLGERLYFQPLCERSASGIEVKLWMGRAVKVYEQLGVVSGPLYRVVTPTTNKVKRATISDLDILFHDVLKRVQIRYPNVINPSVNVEDDYSVKRSLRRGVTTEAQNKKVPRDVIDANNRWRRQMRSLGIMPSMSMIERYSDAKASVESLVQFSERV